MQAQHTTYISLVAWIQHIGTTKRCLNTAARPFGIAPIMLNAVNDTLIFIAITYRILSYSVVGNSRSARARSFFEADGLPRLSKALLQGGQLYYLCVIHNYARYYRVLIYVL
jgi:hypothetical protein